MHTSDPEFVEEILLNVPTVGA